MPRERITVLVATGLHRPNEGAELAEVVGDPWVLDTVRVENHFARDDAAHVDLGVTPRRAHAGEARPPLRRGGPAHRHRAGRAAFHGRLLGRPEGHRAGRRARGHDPHVPQRALHGGPGGDPVQPRRQPAARGAARDRADAGRGLRAQHGDRRGPRSRPRQLRRGHREPPRGGRVRRREHARAGRPALFDDRDVGGRASARQDLLPDGEGHGDAARHPGAGRHADRRLGLLRGLRLARVPRRAGSGCARSAPTRSCRRCSRSASPTSTSGRPRCS